MGVRQLINDGNVAARIVVGLLAVASLGLLAWQLRGSGLPDISGGAYFYSLASGELFVADNTEIPPIQGGDGVRAHVFSCGDCADAAARYIGWLETYTDEAKAALAQETIGEQPVLPPDPMIAAEPRAGEPPTWFIVSSPQAMRIQQAATTRCGDKSPNHCMPGS
jgi:hypothetical protein